MCSANAGWPSAAAYASELAHPLHRERAGLQRRAEDQSRQCLPGPAQRRRRRLGRAGGLDRRQLPVWSRDGHDPGEQTRADLAGLGVLAQRRVDRQRLPPHLRVSGYPVPLVPDLAQGGELALVKRRNQRVGPGGPTWSCLSPGGLCPPASCRACPAPGRPRLAVPPLPGPRWLSPDMSSHPLPIGRPEAVRAARESPLVTAAPARSGPDVPGDDGSRPGSSAT